MLHLFFWEQVSFGICGSIRLKYIWETSEACFACGCSGIHLKSTEKSWRRHGKSWLYVSSILLYLPKLFPERVYWHHLCTKFFKRPFVSSKFFSFCPEVSAPSHDGSRRGFHIESFLGRVVHVDNKRPATTTWLFGRIATVVKKKQKKQNDDCWWGNMLHDMGFTCRAACMTHQSFKKAHFPRQGWCQPQHLSMMPWCFANQKETGSRRCFGYTRA